MFCSKFSTKMLKFWNHMEVRHTAHNQTNQFHFWKSFSISKYFSMSKYQNQPWNFCCSLYNTQWFVFEQTGLRISLPAEPGGPWCSKRADRWDSSWPARSLRRPWIGCTLQNHWKIFNQTTEGKITITIDKPIIIKKNCLKKEILLNSSWIVLHNRITVQSKEILMQTTCMYIYITNGRI